MYKFALFFLSSFLLLPNGASWAQSVSDSLIVELDEISDRNHLPGFASVIIRDGDVKFSEAFGWADINTKKAYTTQSLQNIASISKTFIGVALMKAEELGILNLDDPINQYLEYHIVNPRHNKVPITIRHLATHTSSFKDPDEYERAYIFERKIDIDLNKIPKDWKEELLLYNTNTRVSLDNFVKSIYVPGGQYYSRKNFSKRKPGKEFNYSNIGAGLASRIIEIASGKSFENFTQDYIFDPIGMKSTSWSLDKIDISQKVTPYITREVSIPHYSLVTFADGGLITNVEDMSLYIIEMMKCYNGEGKVLTQEKCKEMMTPYLKGKKDKKYGVFWEISKSGSSIGHNGGDPGSVTNIYFMPSTGVAKILFCNMIPYDDESGKAFGDVWATMRKYQLGI